MELLLAPQSWPFVAAAAFVLFIAVLEGVALLAGLSLTGWLDHLIPDVDVAHDIDAPVDSWLGWLHVGKVPLLILLLVFLTAFSVIGLITNSLIKALFGFYPPALISSLAAFLCAVPVVHTLGQLAGSLIPRDETSAEPLGNLVGRVGVVVNGTAMAGNPAEARVRNAHGHAMYVRIEPDGEGSLATGASVLLVRQISGKHFIAIANPRPDIL